MSEDYSDLFSNGLASTYSKPTSSYGNWNANTQSYDLGTKSLDALNTTGMFDNGYKLPGQLASATSYTPPTTGAESSLWDDAKGLLSNENFMTGALGVGQLGLGLANYLQMKPLYEEQLKGLKQNRQFAAENQQNRKNIASDLGG